MNDTRKMVRQRWPGMALVSAVALLAAGLFSVPNSAALTVTSATSDNGYPAHKVQWTDSTGLPRTAIMVDQNPAAAPYTGYLRQYTYQVNGTNRVCTGTENYATGGNLEFSGDGFVQNHTGFGGDYSSGNGAGVPGTTTITLQGTDHALITYAMATYQIADKSSQSQTVPTTVQWFFADGRSHPIWAITQDARGLPGNIGGDTRSPYGDMAYDGDGVNAYVGGAAYGDTYKFVTLAANPEVVTKDSGWRDTEPNTIPYAMQWANPAQVDAEMGHVATVPITVSDQGSDSRVYPAEDPRNTNSARGMLADENWAFQILNYQFPAGAAVPITAKRLTWGSNFGRVGGFDDYGGYSDTTANITNYSQHVTDPVGVSLSGSRASGMLLAYSVFIVFGTHDGGYTNGTVGQQVSQMENVTHATFAAATGTVATTGPAGVGSAASATITYTPAGYNPTYATWEIAAATNAVNATLTPGPNFPLDHPLFVITGYTTNQLPASIAVGAGLTNAGVNYFATVDTAGQRLWITVNRLVTNSLNLVVSPLGGGRGLAGPVISSFSPTNGAVGTAVVITGQNFTGATAVAFNGGATRFTVDSVTQITATVPGLATTGPVTVTTPGGTGSSAVDFIVLAADLPIYVDSLTNGFAADMSWAASVNLANPAPVYSGNYSIAVTAGQWTALWLAHAPFNTAPYASLSFWINGGPVGAAGLQVLGVVTNNYQAIDNLPTLARNTWTKFTLPLSALGVANITNCQGFWFRAANPGPTTFYVDAIQLHSATVTNGQSSVATPTITPAGGTFSNSVPVTLKCTTAGATIRYTTTGIPPTSTSPIYKAKLTLTNAVTLEAVAFKTTLATSALAAAAFTIIPPPPLTIITTSVPAGKVSVRYSTGVKVQATGGVLPYKWLWAAQAPSKLPPGLTLNATTGAITGKPTKAGLFTITVKVTDGKKQICNHSLTITVTN